MQRQILECGAYVIIASKVVDEPAAWLPIAIALYKVLPLSTYATVFIDMYHIAKDAYEDYRTGDYAEYWEPRVHSKEKDKVVETEDKSILDDTKKNNSTSKKRQLSVSFSESGSVVIKPNTL